MAEPLLLSSTEDTGNPCPIFAFDRQCRSMEPGISDSPSCWLRLPSRVPFPSYSSSRCGLKSRLKLPFPPADASARLRPTYPRAFPLILRPWSGWKLSGWICPCCRSAADTRCVMTAGILVLKKIPTSPRTCLSTASPFTANLTSPPLPPFVCPRGSMDFFFLYI